MYIKRSKRLVKYRNKKTVGKYKSKVKNTNTLSKQINRKANLHKAKIKSIATRRNKYTNKYRSLNQPKRRIKYNKDINKSEVTDTSSESLKYAGNKLNTIRSTTSKINRHSKRRKNNYKKGNKKVYKSTKYKNKGGSKYKQSTSKLKGIVNNKPIGKINNKSISKIKSINLNTAKSNKSIKTAKATNLISSKKEVLPNKVLPPFYLPSKKVYTSNKYNGLKVKSIKLNVKAKSLLMDKESRIKSRIDTEYKIVHQDRIKNRKKKLPNFTDKDVKVSNRYKNPNKYVSNTFSSITYVNKNKRKIDKENITDTSSESLNLAKNKIHTIKKASNDIRTIAKPKIHNTKSTGKRSVRSQIRTKNNINRNVVRVSKGKGRVAKVTFNKVGHTTTNIIKSAKVLANPVVLKGAGIVVGIAVAVAIFVAIMSSITSSVTLLFTALSSPLAEDELIETFVYRIQELDGLANQQLESLKNSEGYDDIEFKFNGDESSVFSNVQDFIVLLTVHEDQNLEESSIEVLDMIHDISFEIETEEETYIEIEVIEIVHDDGSVSYVEIEVEKLRLIITLTTYNFEQLMDLLEFDEGQKEWARFMASNDLRLFFPNLPSGTFPGINGLSREEIDEILATSPSTSVTRNALIEQALTLYGYTTYQLGGKARYDNPRPTALDCSGFVDWVYGSAGVSSILGGGGTAFQWGVTFPINESDLLPGDLAFMQPPSTVPAGSYNHVGIYMGKDSSGNNIYIHSAYPMGVTVDNGTMFKHFRRVPVNFGD